MQSEESKIMENKDLHDRQDHLNQNSRLETLHWYTNELPPPSLPTYIDTIIISPI